MDGARSIQCHNGKLAWIDAEDWDRLKPDQFVWYHTRNGVFRKEPDSPNPRSVYLHREVMDHPEGLYIGFLDGDRTNCRKANLYSFEPGKKREALARLRKGQ